jgi:hypothetical protein
MRRHTSTSLIVALALTGCGTATTTTTATATTPHPAAAATASHAAGSQTERPPTCYPVIFTENSGNGPTYHVRICDALLRPQPGHEWQLIVDGGPLGNRAVIFGEQVPR